MRMTQDEKQGFLAGLHVGMLGLNDPGRGPLTVPVWYDYEPGGQLWFLIGAESRKGRLLEVGTRLSLTAQNESPPYSYVSIEGPVASITPSTLEELTDMAVRYLGPEMGRSYAEDSGTDGQVVIRVDTERWLGVDYGKTG